MATDMSSDCLKVFTDPDERKILSATVIKARIDAWLTSTGIAQANVGGFGFLGDYLVVIHK